MEAKKEIQEIITVTLKEYFIRNCDESLDEVLDVKGYNITVHSQKRLAIIYALALIGFTSEDIASFLNVTLSRAKIYSERQLDVITRAIGYDIYIAIAPVIMLYFAAKLSLVKEVSSHVNDAMVALAPCISYIPALAELDEATRRKKLEALVNKDVTNILMRLESDVENYKPKQAE